MIALVSVIAGGALLLIAGMAVASTPTRKAKDDEAGPDGLVPGDPLELAKRAGASLDVYALARMIRSEHGRDAEVVRLATAWVALNAARKSGITVGKKLLNPQGKFGAQWTGKFAATTLPPRAEDLKLAAAVMSGARPDPTGGAVQFDSPKAQRAALARGVSGYSKTPEDVERSRVAEGKQKVLLAGVPEDQIRFWRVG